MDVAGRKVARGDAALASDDRETASIAYSTTTAPFIPRLRCGVQ
jgi:hypothetical protein